LIVSTHTPTTLVSLLAGRILRKGIPVWFYQDYPGMFEGRPDEAWLLRHALAWHRGAVVVSHYSAQELLSFSSGDVRYIGDALSHYPVFDAWRDQPMQPRSVKQIMYLGDFRPRKGLADFLQAAEIVYRSVPEIELLLVLKEDGEIKTPVPYRKVLRPTTPELARCYAASDIFVSASWYEGFGLPPVEAMACGTPVVLTDSGGVRDFARSGENCLMVPAKNPPELATAILELLGDPSLAEKFRQKGPLTAQEYTWEKVSDRMETALLDFVTVPAARPSS
jgi:glycosyltransferase involved in cell wall biosynthesis